MWLSEDTSKVNPRSGNSEPFILLVFWHRWPFSIHLYSCSGTTSGGPFDPDTTLFPIATKPYTVHTLHVQISTSYAISERLLYPVYPQFHRHI